jgi:hypothetical protein
MVISRYPRPGHPIAPGLLREVLRTELPDHRISQAVQLADLDESAWARFNTATCKRLAEAVIATIPTRLPNLIGQRYLPKVPDNITGDDLLLEPRTRNCLSKQGLLEPPQKLASLTIDDVLQIPCFGKKCLVDLLTSLETVACRAAIGTTDGGRPVGPETYSLSGKARRAAHKLQRLKGASLIRHDDPRFGHLIRETGLDARNAKELAGMLLSGRVVPVSPALVQRCVLDLFEGIRAARRITLENELWDVTRELGDERDRRIIVRRVGWDGKPPKTLESVGQRYGITRERVRQICTRVDGVQRHEVFLPVLDRVIDVVAAGAPSAADGLEKELVRKGLTESVFDLSSLHDIAQGFGRKPRFAVETVHGRRVVVPPTSGNLLDQLCETASSRVCHWGVANVEDLAAATKTTSAVVRKILPFVPKFKWLDESSGWFWIADVPRNSLLTPMRKILAVSPTIDVGELRAGVGRPHRRKGFAPPRRVLLEVCRQLPWCKVDGSIITVTRNQTPDEVLSDSERIIFKTLKEYGPVLQRSEFEKLCLAAGVNRNSFPIFLSYCPIITKYASGVYGLRGAAVPPGVVERLIPRRPRKSKLLLDYGWTKDRKIELLYHVSKGMVSNGIVSVPAALKSFLQGRFELMTADGASVGALVVRKQTGWGLGPFFRRRGGEPDDFLSITFDPSEKVAVIQIGDVSLADQFGAPTWSRNETSADDATEVLA